MVEGINSLIIGQLDGEDYMLKWQEEWHKIAFDLSQLDSGNGPEALYSSDTETILAESQAEMMDSIVFSNFALHSITFSAKIDLPNGLDPVESVTKELYTALAQ